MKQEGSRKAGVETGQESNQRRGNINKQNKAEIKQITYGTGPISCCVLCTWHRDVSTEPPKALLLKGQPPAPPLPGQNVQCFRISCKVYGPEASREWVTMHGMKQGLAGHGLGLEHSISHGHGLGSGFRVSIRNMSWDWNGARVACPATIFGKLPLWPLHLAWLGRPPHLPWQGAWLASGSLWPQYAAWLGWPLRQPRQGAWLVTGPGRVPHWPQHAAWPAGSLASNRAWGVAKRRPQQGAWLATGSERPPCQPRCGTRLGTLLGRPSISLEVFLAWNWTWNWVWRWAWEAILSHSGENSVLKDALLENCFWSSALEVALVASGESFELVTALSASLCIGAWSSAL